MIFKRKRKQDDFTFKEQIIEIKADDVDSIAMIIAAAVCYMNLDYKSLDMRGLYDSEKNKAGAYARVKLWKRD